MSTITYAGMVSNHDDVLDKFNDALDRLDGKRIVVSIRDNHNDTYIAKFSGTLSGRTLHMASIGDYYVIDIYNTDVVCETEGGLFDGYVVVTI
jgi:hypothetical protein